MWNNIKYEFSNGQGFGKTIPQHSFKKKIKGVCLINFTMKFVDELNTKCQGKAYEEYVKAKIAFDKAESP